MEVVINKCYGGFSLSHEAVMRYAELKGLTLYPFFTRYMPGGCIENVPYNQASLEEQQHGIPGYYQTPDHQKKSYFSSRDIERDDPNLVKVVKKLGEKANGPCAKLAIVYVPDDVKWHIEEYDGREHVAEDHRTWS